MSLEFSSLKTNGVYSKIFINKATRMLIKINTTPFVHLEEETEHFIDKISIREAVVLKKIGFHPNIITPTSISLRNIPDDSGSTFFVSPEEKTPLLSQAGLTIGMELGVVSKRKKKGAPIPTNAAIATFLHQIACGLAYAHACDIAHRDIKPDNIVKTSKGFYQLIDWGLAGLAPGEKQSASKKYVTRWYRPPELLDREIEQTDHRAADIWALAITTLEIYFDSSQLFAKTNRTQLFMATRLSKQTPSQIQTFFRDAPIDIRFADLLSQMLTRHPDSRITAENILSHSFISEYTAYAPPLTESPAKVLADPLVAQSPSAPGRPASARIVPLFVREKMYEWMCGLWAYYKDNIRTITLFTAYEICDRYSRVALLDNVSSYQVVGCASMAIADALYDTWSLSHEDYVTAAGEFFTIADLEQMILSISKVLEWDLYTPGVYTQWKPQVQDSDDVKSVVALAATIADRKKSKWSQTQIVEAALQTPRIPKRFTLFRQLLVEDEEPSLTPLVF